MSRRAALGTIASVVVAVGSLVLPNVAAEPGNGGGGGKPSGKPTTTTTTSTSTSSTTTTTSTSTTTTSTTAPTSDPNLSVVIEGESTVVDPGNLARQTACAVVTCAPEPFQDVVVRNEGDRAASAVTVAITPDVSVRNGEARVVVEPATGQCSTDWMWRTYTCTLGTIPAHAAVTVRMTYVLYGTILWPAPAGATVQEPSVAEVATTATVGTSSASASMVIVKGIGLWVGRIP